MDPLLDHAPCGYLLIADDGYVREANATAGEMLQASPAGLTGRHVDHLLAPPSRIFYQTHVFPTLKLQGSVHEVYVSMLDAKREEVPVLLNAARRAREGRFESEWVV